MFPFIPEKPESQKGQKNKVQNLTVPGAAKVRQGMDRDREL